MTNNRVIIAGGGIGGLALALTLHQIGVECLVLESVNELKPLGVGINLQPNAVRELFDLGFSQSELDACGVPAKEWALVGMKGQEIYSEARGMFAGYNWPQYAVHRGKFHMMLAEALMARAGKAALRLGSRVTGYEHNEDGTVTAIIEQANYGGAISRLKRAKANIVSIPVEKDGMSVSGGSIMGLLMLAASRGTEIRVRTDGAQSQALLDALAKLVANRFGEPF